MDKSISTTNSKNTINNNKKIEENEEKSIWDNIIDFFKPKNNEKLKKQEIPNIRGGYIKCSCPKTHSKYYCDSVYELINMIQNNQDIDSETSKKLYEGLLRVYDRKLDTNGENILQIKKDLHRTFPSSVIMKTPRIQAKLKNVLRAFSNYEPNLKYFQGMNFIL